MAIQGWSVSGMWTHEPMATGAEAAAAGALAAEDAGAGVAEDTLAGAGDGMAGRQGRTNGW